VPPHSHAAQRAATRSHPMHTKDTRGKLKNKTHCFSENDEKIS
jgi:hypothetical protein